VRPRQTADLAASRGTPTAILERGEEDEMIVKESPRFLCAGHAAFDRRLDEIVACARARQWNELDMAWEAFASDLTDHLAYEELEIFDDFGRESTANAAALTQLLADHEALRGWLATMAAEIRARQTAHATLDAFVALLCAHAEREEASVYPWLEQRRGSHARIDRTV
jgi:hemerythrin superfamily protein